MISAATEVCIRRVLINLARSVQQLIKEGGATVVVSGLTPIGCATGNLVLFGSQNEADYEPDTGCLKDLNSLSRDHNLQLRRALSGSTTDTPAHGSPTPTSTLPSSTSW
jgi:hypothetical protein